MASGVFNCPMCDYTSPLEEEILYHFEEQHTDDSPFVARGASPTKDSSIPATSQSKSAEKDESPSPSNDDAEFNYVKCEVEDCGEIVLLSDLAEHMEMHDAEEMSLALDEADSATAREQDEQDGEGPSGAGEDDATGRFDTNIADGLRRSARNSKKQPSPAKRTGLTRSLFDSIAPRTAESKGKDKGKKVAMARKKAKKGREGLGPYAWEDEMPATMLQEMKQPISICRKNILRSDGKGMLTLTWYKNETPDLIPELARLSETDRNIRKAWYCDDAVHHVGKTTTRDTGFCGYKNIQVMLSYIQNARSKGYKELRRRGFDMTPGILDLQDMIEEAWDKGFCSFGRKETGGVKGTRKWIGTSELAAVLTLLNVDFTPESFQDDLSTDHQAYEALLSYVSTYFRRGVRPNCTAKVHQTSLPPLFLQQPGHSLTIVGYEIRKNGAVNLVVYNNMFRPPPALNVHNISKIKPKATVECMKGFRRNEERLRNHNAFEVVALVPEEWCLEDCEGCR
ncbi:hypothetical protein P152DRAFT_395122 [Eremomyces bilateralis CBS 781.70]|uniref:C2H2-type domain-containing protein n=1 Tax=Eremomyces bilateralis CBS 781.70 TaxID=1392243 RepID=A0A6G1G5F9_9PEZI|nr:uncharacterized protein P152DRAFT_395122 [Eremomyces bilateralis CBS 781.70]KAF1813293.1 hypothetical protein P152DRAFT_395122 [Eremomyces bilateralis CBS 781.70]